MYKGFLFVFPQDGDISFLVSVLCKENWNPVSSTGQQWVVEYVITVCS